MKSEEKAMIKNYIRRFFDPQIPSAQKKAAFLRYAEMGPALLYEKIRGLDYTWLYSYSDEGEYRGGYTKTPRAVLLRIFDFLENVKQTSFMDIGCGKGYVVSQAKKIGCARVGGVEYSKHLYDICINNLKIEKIPSGLVFNGDARTFEQYSLFDVFFMNNPFHADVMRDTCEKLYQSHAGKECVIFYMNPLMEDRTRAIESAGFLLVNVIKDPAERYFDVNVYSNVGGRNTLLKGRPE